ncbi:MAG: hypothetical protein VX911_01955 [Candidatus Latescibacterota bacterium]|nr:hypothetical protein [Candidatus Latescibacterota bacterium]
MADKISDDVLDRLLAACRENQQSTGRGGDAGFERTPVSYDFKRPHRIKKDQARGLESIYEQFCRLISPTWCMQAIWEEENAPSSPEPLGRAPTRQTPNPGLPPCR